MGIIVILIDLFIIAFQVVLMGLSMANFYLEVLCCFVL